MIPRSARPTRRGPRRAPRPASAGAGTAAGLTPGLHARVDGCASRAHCCADARRRRRPDRARLVRENARARSARAEHHDTMTKTRRTRGSFLEARGTFTNGSAAACPTSAMPSTICSATSVPASDWSRASVPGQLQPAPQHGDPPDLAQARRQQRVEQEADEERRHDVDVLEAAALRGSCPGAVFQTDRLEQDRSEVRPNAAITHHQPTSIALTVSMSTERSASSIRMPKTHEPGDDAPGRRAPGGRPRRRARRR